VLVAVIGGHAAATELLFRHLKLGGVPVQWIKTAAHGQSELRITYRIVSQATQFAGATNCSDLRPPEAMFQRSGITREIFEREVAAAFALWSEVARITFAEASLAEPADILIGAQGIPDGRAFAQVFHDANDPRPIKPIVQSLVCLNPLVPWKVGFDGNLEIYDLRYTLAHEIGHAIGLDHPPGGGQLMWYLYDEQFRSLRPGDVAGIVSLYGARPQQGHGQSGG
jgi:hypothetical protein